MAMLHTITVQDLLSQQVKEGAERQGKLEQELAECRNKVSEVEDARRKAEAELKEKYEECKVQVSGNFNLIMIRLLFP